MCDFQETLELAREWMDEHGINQSELSDWEAIESYLTIQDRRIEPKKRWIAISTRLQERRLPYYVRQGVNMIGTKFQRGDDVNGHLTRKFLEPAFVDKLYSDWGIQHLHLSEKPDKKRKWLFRGTKLVLFAWITDNFAYFINVGEHDDRKRGKYPFAEIQLLETIVDEWPHLLESYRIPMATGLECSLRDSKKVMEMRTKNTNLLHMIRGQCYVPPGIGLTTGGTPIRVRIKMNLLRHSLT